MNQPRPYNTRSGYQEEPSANEMAAVSQSLARSEQKDDGLAGSFEGTPPSITQTTPQDPMAMMAQAMAALLASSNDDKFFLARAPDGGGATKKGGGGHPDGNGSQISAGGGRTTEERGRGTDQVGES